MSSGEELLDCGERFCMFEVDIALDVRGVVGSSLIAQDQVRIALGMSICN